MELIVFCYYYQNTASIQSFVPFFSCWAVDHIKKKLIASKRSFVNKIWCVSLLPVYCNQSPCLSTFSCFFTPTSNLHTLPFLSILHLRVIYRGNFFRGKISISGWISYTIILLCYWKRFVKENSNKEIQLRLVNINPLEKLTGSQFAKLNSRELLNKSDLRKFFFLR